jgi:hypothetical protein
MDCILSSQVIVRARIVHVVFLRFDWEIRVDGIILGDFVDKAWFNVSWDSLFPVFQQAFRELGVSVKDRKGCSIHEGVTKRSKNSLAF